MIEFRLKEYYNKQNEMNNAWYNMEINIRNLGCCNKGNTLSINSYTFNWPAIYFNTYPLEQFLASADKQSHRNNFILPRNRENTYTTSRSHIY